MVGERVGTVASIVLFVVVFFSLVSVSSMVLLFIVVSVVASRLVISILMPFAMAFVILTSLVPLKSAGAPARRTGVGCHRRKVADGGAMRPHLRRRRSVGG